MTDWCSFMCKCSIWLRNNLPGIFDPLKDIESEGKIINIDISTVPENPQNGEDLTVNVKVANVSDSDLTVSVNTVLNACLYTGQKKGFVAQDIAEEAISPGEGDYIKKNSIII